MTVVSLAEARRSGFRPEWQHVYVDDSRVEVLGLGEGQPLLFLHGWGLSPRAYLAPLRSLAGRGYRILAPSLPGFGRSDPRRNRDHSLNGIADHMIGALDALALADRMPLIAHSFGAGVSLRIAALRPDLLSRLTLISPVGGAGHEPVSWRHVVRGMCDDASPRIAVAGLRDFLGAALRDPAAITASGLAARRADSVTDLRTSVGSGIPVRLVFADSDRVVRPGDLPTCAGGLSTETVRGSHGWLLSEPERFAGLVTNRPDPMAVTA